ncbi:MAG: CotH kinase family protein [Polyangiaceae bacterium]
MRTALLLSLCLSVACGDSGAGGSGGAGGSSNTAGGQSTGGAPAGGADAGGGGAGGSVSVKGAAFFDTTTLHTVDIQVDDQYLETLDADITQRVPCTITYDGETVMNAGIRKKGQSTLRPLSDKPSFSVKLDETVAGQDIDGIEKFALNNTIMDPTYTSEPLSYLLYSRAGIPAPRTAHAVVRFNGETKGFYVVVEATNKQFLAEHYGDGSGNLYEGPWDFNQDPAAADLKDVEDGRTRDDLVALAQVVTNAADADLLSQLDPLMDVDEVLKTFALDMAFCLWDGYAIAAWNFYLYHVPNARFVLLPHGADWPYWHADVDPLNVDFRPWGADYPAGSLAIRLTTGSFQSHYVDLLRTVRDQAFDVAALQARIDQIEGLIQSADSGDPVLAQAQADLAAGIGDARNFVAERRAFLDGY